MVSIDQVGQQHPLTGLNMDPGHAQIFEQMGMHPGVAALMSSILSPSDLDALIGAASNQTGVRAPLNAAHGMSPGEVDTAYRNYVQTHDQSTDGGLLTREGFENRLNGEAMDAAYQQYVVNHDQSTDGGLLTREGFENRVVDQAYEDYVLHHDQSTDGGLLTREGFEQKFREQNGLSQQNAPTPSAPPVHGMSPAELEAAYRDYVVNHDRPTDGGLLTKEGFEDRLTNDAIDDAYQDYVVNHDHTTEGGLLTQEAFEAKFREENDLPPAASSSAVAPEEPQSPSGSYSVAAGDNLWDISAALTGDPQNFKEIAELNGIDNPSLIHPGQNIEIPEEMLTEAGKEALGIDAQEAPQAEEAPQAPSQSAPPSNGPR